MIKLNVYCSCFYPDGEIMTSFGEKITGGAGMKNNIFILDQINFPELARPSLFASKKKQTSRAYSDHLEFGATNQGLNTYDNGLYNA